MADPINPESMDLDELANDLEDLEANLDDESLDDLGDADLDAELDDDQPSYGTSFHDQPRLSTSGTLYDRLQDFNEADPSLTGGDIDANWEQANAVGDESVGGTAPTPDMDVVDELGTAVGLEMDDRAYLRTNEILEGRDQRRWELDPESAEDYDASDVI
jgi:hypothetical protein